MLSLEATCGTAALSLRLRVVLLRDTEEGPHSLVAELHFHFHLALILSSLNDRVT